MSDKSFHQIELEAWSERAGRYDALFAPISTQVIAGILDSLGDIRGKSHLVMACGTGHRLQRRLSEQEILLPIIFLTGHGDIPMSVRAIKAGATDFLTKPVDAAQLIQAVRAALEVAETRRQAIAETEAPGAPISGLMSVVLSCCGPREEEPTIEPASGTPLSGSRVPQPAPEVILPLMALEFAWLISPRRRGGRPGVAHARGLSAGAGGRLLPAVPPM